MNSEPSGSMVFDTGPMLEMVNGSDQGLFAKDLLISQRIDAFVNELSLGDLRYLVCRSVNDLPLSRIVFRSQ